METIKNELDTLNPPKNKYAVTQNAGEYSMDFIASDNLDEIETGIRETTQGIQVASLAIAVALAKIDREGLYAQAGFDSLTEYTRESEGRLNLSKQATSELTKIGHTYVTHRSKLEKYGYTPDSGITKLRYLDLALQRGRADKVFKLLASSTFREFKTFATGEPAGLTDKMSPDDITDVGTIELSDAGIIFHDDVPEQVRREFESIASEYVSIKRSGNKPVLINVYDDAEAIAVKRYLSRSRASK